MHNFSVIYGIWITCWIFNEIIYNLLLPAILKDATDEVDSLKIKIGAWILGHSILLLIAPVLTIRYLLLLYKLYRIGEIKQLEKRFNSSEDLNEKKEIVEKMRRLVDET